MWGDDDVVLGDAAELTGGTLAHSNVVVMVVVVVMVRWMDAWVALLYVSNPFN